MKRISFPLAIRRGSVVVKVYRVMHREAKDGVIYQVTWHAGGRRVSRQFTDRKKALEEASLKAEQLAAGRVGAAELTADDADLLSEARKMTGEIPIIAALDEWSRARDLAGGDLIPAAKAWRDAHGTKVKKITVAKAVEAFLASKRRAGVDVKASYLKTLPRLKEQLEERAIGSLS